MNATVDYSTATPVEIDTELSAIYTRYYTVLDKIAQHAKWIKDYEKGLARKDAGDGRYLYYTQERLVEIEQAYDDLQEQATMILEETHPYEAEFRSRPWTRFFLVTNNGGHIHSSMHCSTCYPTTRFAWLPSLSGQTEAEAVAEHGAILCTVCYPTAPVEWTDRHDDSVCPGTGTWD